MGCDSSIVHLLTRNPIQVNKHERLVMLFKILIYASIIYRLIMKAGGNGERAPLRTVLQNFLNHVETLEKRKNGGDDQYDKEFQELKLLSESLKGMSMYSCKEGEKEVNRRKNRYKDILPCEYNLY
jgi:hypothetical protein